MNRFYTVEKPLLRWGDYHYILVHGMSCHLVRVDGRIQLERTGPFVPPISFPGISDLVVTNAFRRELENSRLIGLHYQPIIKKLIVKSDWHKWDQTAEEPPKYRRTVNQKITSSVRAILRISASKSEICGSSP